jgi:translation initiation factor IF-2
VYLETLGGDIPWVALSAKTGEGVDKLLDLILLVAELNEFRADTTLPASGYVIEAHRDQKRGIAATLIITNGTLESGMSILAGRAISPVRIMEDHLGKSLRSATFSTPITLTGFDELPAVGETFLSYKNKKEAETARELLAAAPHEAPTESHLGSSKYYLPVIIRADASGSLEAIAHEALKIGDEHAGVSVVLSGIGNISENDVKAAMAGASHAILIGFNVKVDSIAEALALQHGVTIETFNIIYKLTEHLEERLATLKPKRTIEEISGRARVIKQFNSQKEIHVVGGGVTEGFLSKGGIVRIIRRKVVIGTGKILNMQANKQNVSRVEATSEFGTQIEAKFEIAEGDILEQFTMITV